MIQRHSSVAFDNWYEWDTEIGAGSFATVHKASRKKYPGEYVAVKGVHKDCPDGDTEEMLEALWNEVKILERVLHPHVLRTFEVYDSPSKLMFVMEFCAGGEYLEHVKKTGEPFGIQETAAMVLAVLGALRFLHFKGISHRDLKPDNLLRDSWGAVKVADFGLANVFKAANATKFKKRMRGMCGTPGYWAPEVCSYGTYTEACDMWSLGVITFYALSGGCLPFPQTEENEFGTPAEADEMSRLMMPKLCDRHSEEFIKSLLAFDPWQRPNPEAAVKLHFVNQILEQQTAAQKQHRSLVPNELIEDFCEFAEAPPLKRLLGMVAARHLHISRVPATEMLRQGFNYLDPGRDGFVTVKSIVQQVKNSHAKLDINLQEFEKRFETCAEAAGGKPGCVDWSCFLATEAVKHIHSMKAAFDIIKDSSEGLTIEALQKLGEASPQCPGPCPTIVPKELRDRDKKSVVSSNELLDILGVISQAQELQFTPMEVMTETPTAVSANGTQPATIKEQQDDSSTGSQQAGACRLCPCCARKRRARVAPTLS